MKSGKSSLDSFTNAFYVKDLCSSVLNNLNIKLKLIYDQKTIIESVCIDLTNKISFFFHEKLHNLEKFEVKIKNANKQVSQNKIQIENEINSPYNKNKKTFSKKNINDFLKIHSDISNLIRMINEEENNKNINLNFTQMFSEFLCFLQKENNLHNNEMNEYANLQYDHSNFSKPFENNNNNSTQIIKINESFISSSGAEVFQADESMKNNSTKYTSNGILNSNEISSMSDFQNGKKKNRSASPSPTRSSKRNIFVNNFIFEYTNSKINFKSDNQSKSYPLDSPLIITIYHLSKNATNSNIYEICNTFFSRFFFNFNQLKNQTVIYGLSKNYINLLTVFKRVQVGSSLAAKKVLIQMTKNYDNFIINFNCNSYSNYTKDELYQFALFHPELENLQFLLSTMESTSASDLEENILDIDVDRMQIEN